MTDQWFKFDRVFDGHAIHELAAIRVRDGRVVGLRTNDIPAAAEKMHGALSPGLVDLQVNGGGGVLLNNDPTTEAMQKIANAHRKFGTTAIMPTVITDHPDVLSRAADAAIDAIKLPGIIGLHIEGPHIATERRGTHRAEFIRPLDDHTINIVGRLRQADIPVMLTLAPEIATVKQIEQLAGMGSLVSIGHTNATAQVVRDAIAAGASCATHLYNAMSPMTGREPGVTGAVINSNLYAGIICDGYHVTDEMVAMAIRARPLPDRMFLVSDAMSTVGGPDHFDLYGQRIALKNGRLINSEGNLAGAHVTLAQSIKRLVEHADIPLHDALRMATLVPATCVGKPELSSLMDRSVDDLVVFDDAFSVGSLSAVLR